MNQYHLLHAISFPTGASYRRERFVQLLDDMNLAERNELLEVAYLAYDADFVGPANKPDMLATYQNFRERFDKRCKSLTFDEYEVYAVISYVLARAYQKVFSGLQGLIDRQVGGNDTEPHGASENVLGLINEVALARRAYQNFCELVLRPLLEPEYPGAD